MENIDKIGTFQGFRFASRSVVLYQNDSTKTGIYSKKSQKSIIFSKIVLLLIAKVKILLN